MRRKIILDVIIVWINIESGIGLHMYHGFLWCGWEDDGFWGVRKYFSYFGKYIELWRSYYELFVPMETGSFYTFRDTENVKFLGILIPSENFMFLYI